MGDEYPTYLTDLDGQVTLGGELSATADTDAASTDEPLLRFGARVTGFETMNFQAEGARKGVELERARTDLPEGMGLAAVQAVYSRGWVWFADHASADVEDSLGVDYEDEVDPDNP